MKPKIGQTVYIMNKAKDFILKGKVEFLGKYDFLIKGHKDGKREFFGGHYDEHGKRWFGALLKAMDSNRNGKWVRVDPFRWQLEEYE